MHRNDLFYFSYGNKDFLKSAEMPFFTILRETMPYAQNLPVLLSYGNIDFLKLRNAILDNVKTSGYTK